MGEEVAHTLMPAALWLIAEAFALTSEGWKVIDGFWQTARTDFPGHSGICAVRGQGDQVRLSFILGV